MRSLHYVHNTRRHAIQQDVARSIVNVERHHVALLDMKGVEERRYLDNAIAPQQILKPELRSQRNRAGCLIAPQVQLVTVDAEIVLGIARFARQNQLRCCNGRPKFGRHFCNKFLGAEVFDLDTLNLPVRVVDRELRVNRLGDRIELFELRLPLVPKVQRVGLSCYVCAQLMESRLFIENRKRAIRARGRESA